MALPFTLFCGRSARQKSMFRGECELPLLKKLSNSFVSLVSSLIDDDDSSGKLLEGETCSMAYSSDSSYDKQFPEDDEDNFSFSISSPKLSCSNPIDQYRNGGGHFLEEAWGSIGEKPRDSDYGFFVDLQDSFDPRLYLREDVDANDYDLPPGQHTSKIITRTHLIKARRQDLSR